MGDSAIFHWLALVAIPVLLFLFNWKLFELLRRFGDDINNRKGGPPTHPIPATGPIETSRRSTKSQAE